MCNATGSRLFKLVLPNGDVLVAETSAPERESARQGIKGLVMAKAMQTAGSAVPSADRITLLRDSDRDGQPELRTAFVENLHSPFGMALVGDDLYIADTDSLLEFDYRRDATALPQPGTRVTSLPAGDINYHWTRNVIASRDGARLYVTVGSNSNVGEQGLEQERQRAAILEIDRATGEMSIYASGLRKNRKPPSGYRVIFVPFTAGRPAGMARDVLTGFLDEDGDARGRPVGLAVDATGALLVADDVGNTIWRVTMR